jgi:phage tail sheath gpL-like
VPIATRGASRVASIEIAVTGAATTAGDLRLLFTPKGGETLEIRVSVPNAAGAEAIARELAAALTTAVAPDYAVRRTGPATLNVSCGKKRAPFLLKLAPEPIPGLAVRLD